MSDDTLGASRRHLLNVPCLSPASVSHRSLLCSMSYVYHDTMYTSQDRWVLQRSPGAPSFETPARRPNPTPLRRAIHPHPPPLPSPQRSARAHRTQYTRRWQCGSRSGAGFKHASAKMVNSAWAGDVRWGWSRAGWTATPRHPPPPGSQASCTSCRSPERGIGPRQSPPPHGVHSTLEGHLGVNPLCRGWFCSGGEGVRASPVVANSNVQLLQHSAGGSHSSARAASPSDPHPPMRLVGRLSEAHLRRAVAGTKCYLGTAGHVALEKPRAFG
jgi:hypothetical protein